MSQIVTLLFTDLAGSSALLHRLGDEAGEEMRRLHFGILREAVEENGGQEVKNLGDGLMVVFDSGAAASRSAIAMQQAIARHNCAGGPELGVRVGLHVGEPIRDEDDYFGTAVVVAKRLCDAAEAGQILASGMVRGLVVSKAGFTFTPVADVALKGMDEEVAAFELGWRQESRPANADLSDPPLLVGRADHLEHLEQQLAAAAQGRLRVVLVTGDAGMGKSRLAAELVRRNRDQILPLSARAYPLGATASLGLWVEALERHLRGLPREEVLSLCGGHVSALAGLLPSVRAASREHVPDDSPRVQLLAALAALLDRLSTRSPLVIVFDDVHLADGSSWEALNYLARNVTDSRILIVLAARPAELSDHPMANEVIRSLDQEGLVSRRTVVPLSMEEVGTLAGELIGGPASPALVHWLGQRALGSPLFVGGLVRALLEEGADLDAPVLRSLPEDLADRVEARLHHLDPPSRAVLELLAVAGYRIELGDLLRLTGQTLDDLATILEQLLRVRLVAELEDGRELAYEISHPLIQEAIYRHIGGARRRALHRHAARVLVVAGRYGAAASHVVRAAEPGDDEAIETLCEALRRAEAGGHHREEIALLDALLVLVPAGDRRWMNVLDALPLTPEWVVDHRADTGSDVAVRAMRRADQVLERSSDAAHRAAVKFSLGSLLAWGQCELVEGRAHVLRARELFAEAGDDRAVRLATNELGYHAALADDGVTHERVAREVLAAADEAGDLDLQLQALCSLVWALMICGRLGDCLPVLDRGIDVARRADKLYRLSYLQALLIMIKHTLGGGATAANFEAVMELDPAFRDTMLLDFAGQVRWLAGDLRGAIAACRDQLAWDGGTSPRRALGVSIAVVCLAESGRLDEAAQLQATTEAAMHGCRWWVHSRLVDWSGAVAMALRGDAHGGLDRLSGVVRDAVSCGYWSWARLMLLDMAEEAMWAKDGDVAQEAGAHLRSDPSPPEGSSHDGIRLVVTAGEFFATSAWDAAADSLGEAAAAFGAAGWRLWEGRALGLRGLALAAHERERAAEALQGAVNCLDACGAVVRRDRALRTLDSLGTRGRRTKVGLVGPEALTARERDVARLAAEGCSAKEIAARLFIGERTVETHLANSYAKLGVTSKVDLVRRAAELRL
ncbi:MAG: hypothetical protein NVS3B12_03730 [Acidimicrobiales bacterium]